MKYYEKMIDMGCFSREDINSLAGNPDAAHSILYDYTQKGLIERVRRDLYVTISLETKQPVRNRYAIASKITESSYITHHSAFEYYGCANQVYYEVYVGGDKYFKPFSYDDIEYKYIKPHISDGVVVAPNGIMVTDIERTLLDSINDFEKIAGLEELLKCIQLIPSVNEDVLLKYLKLYNRKHLYQKTGYILEHFRDILNLSDKFFCECLNNIPFSKCYLYNTNRKKELELNSKWNLFVPPELMFLTSKGVEESAI